MQTLDMCLKELVRQKLVVVDDAITKAQRPDDFKRSLGIMTHGSVI